MARRGLGPVDEEEEDADAVEAGGGSGDENRGMAEPAGDEGGDGAPLGDDGHAEAAAAEGEEAAPGEEEPNVTPEEQAAYEQFIDHGRQLLYDAKALPTVQKAVMADANRPEGAPPEGLASSIITVTQRIVAGAEKSGNQIAPDVIHHAGMALVEDLADFSSEKGWHDYSAEEIEAGMMRYTELLGPMMEGRIDPEQKAAELQQLVDADAKGELASQFPGLAERYGPSVDTGGDTEEEAVDEEYA